MPLRSVIDIDVNDDAFKAFQSLFDKYQNAVGRLPGQWNQVNRAQNQSKNTFVDIAAALMAQQELLRRSTREVEAVDRAVSRTARTMSGLSRSTREFAGYLSTATSTLLKWTGVTGVVGSLVGLLSGEGIGMLAGYGARTFRSTMGYAGPTTAGQVGAAGAYSGILDQRQALGQLTEMLTTAEGKRGLVALGFGPESWGRGAGALLPQFLRRLQGLAKNTPESNFGDVMQGFGLGGFSETARVLRRMTPQQLEQLNEQRAKNERELAKLTTDILFKWTKLSGTLDVAETKIKSAFIIGLEKLTPQIERVTDAFSNAVVHFMESETVQKWMTKLADGLESVDMENFAKRLEEGAIGVFDFTAKVVQALSKLHVSFLDMAAWIDKKTGLSANTREGAVKRGIVGGAVAGAAIGGVVGGPVGAAVGGVIGGAAGAVGGDIGYDQDQRDRVFTGEIPPPRPGEYGYEQHQQQRRRRSSRTTTGTPTQTNFQAGANVAGEVGTHGNLPASVYRDISLAEGTSQNGQINYDDMLTHPGGQLGTPPKPISQMSIEELMDWQTKMLNHPNNRWNSSAAGAFQIIRDNIRRALAEGRLKLTDKFDKNTQEKLAAHLWRHGGSRHWEGFKAYPALRRRAEAAAAQARVGQQATQARAGQVTRPPGTPGDPFAVVRGAPGVKFNSLGKPYSAEIDSMSGQEKANVEASMRAIRESQRSGGAWGRPSGINNPNIATYTPKVNVEKPNGVDVKITQSTGSNSVMAGAQVAQ